MSFDEFTMVVVKRSIKRTIRFFYTFLEYGVGMVTNVSRPQLFAKSAQYERYRIPHEELDQINFQEQRQKTFSTVITALQGSALEWFLVPAPANRPPWIVVFGSAPVFWDALNCKLGKDCILVAQNHRAPDMFDRIGKRIWPGRLWLKNAQVLGPPKMLCHKLTSARRVRLSIYAKDKSQRPAIGHEAGLDVEFWSEGVESACAFGNASSYGRKPQSIDIVREHVLGLSVPVWRSAPSAETLVRFPIDVVYTWVDDQDPQWQHAYAIAQMEENNKNTWVKAANTKGRFANCDELRYSLRSLAEYADWVRHVWIVTAGQRPKWLDNTDWITVVDHQDIFPDTTCLPTFSSRAIESCLHRIEGLADHFLYLNDDFFLGRPVSPEDFFTNKGHSKILPEIDLLPDGPSHPGELGPASAGKNGRRIVEELTGERVSWKYKHAPYALQKEIMWELEHKVPAALDATRKNRFRSYTDVTLANWLHHSYAWATRRAVIAELSYAYVDLDDNDRDRIIHHLERFRPADVFCLNVINHAPPAKSVTRLLENYFPISGPFERQENTV